MDCVLEVERLLIRMAANKEPIVKEISFEIGYGRVLGIVGESGSGKTLICKAIMKLLNPRIFASGGSVRLRGTEILGLTEKQARAVIGRDIAMIMQNPMTAFDPTMKIGTQIVETLQAHLPVSRKQAYERGILELEKMNLSRAAQIMNSYPHTLSGGMLQRVMIALALMLSPAVIIADEATTALDVITQAVVLEEFARIRDSGISLLLVTHDFGVVAQLADDVLVMKEGEIVESGTAQEIFARPQAQYTRELLEARFLVQEGEEPGLAAGAFGVRYA